MGGPGSGRKKGGGKGKATKEYNKLRGIMTSGAKVKINRATAREMAKVAKRRAGK